MLPLLYSMVSCGGLDPASSHDSADREPLPVTMNAMLLPLAQPPLFTSSCAMVERSGVL